MATCKQKIGLLTLRDCKEPVVGSCERCNRPVCAEHHKAARGQNLCVECYLQDIDEVRAASAGVQREYARRQSYRETGYQPYYYGDSPMYGDEAYEYFRRDLEAEYVANDAMDAEDFQDS